MSTFPDLEVRMDNLIVQQNSTVYHWTFVGTNTGPGGTGHQVRISGFETWKINSEGLIVESRGAFNQQEY